MWQEADEEFNTRVIEYFYLFPTVICAPRYNKRFRIYAILKSVRLLKFLLWADLGSPSNLGFWPQIKCNLKKLLIIALWKMFSSVWHILSWLTWLSRTKDIAIGKQRGSMSFSQKNGNRLGCGARVNFFFDNWTKVQLGQKWRIAHDLFGFQCGNIFRSVLPFWQNLSRMNSWHKTGCWPKTI
jgi:hypothetical protein